MSRPQVLVANAEEATLQLIRSVLTTEGYDVDTVGRGFEALQAFAQRHYDLLIAGLRLPDLDGAALSVLAGAGRDGDAAVR